MSKSNYKPKPYKKDLLKTAGENANLPVQATPGRAEDVRLDPGLLTLHNSTLSCGIFYVDGSKLIIKRNKPYKPNENLENAKRGQIVDFSPGSRRRLLRKLAETNRNILPLFGTLTFPDEYHDHIAEPTHWKKLLKRLVARFKRKFPDGAMIWRLETEDRKSGQFVGDIFPHFHLLIYNVDLLTFRAWLALNWWQVCGKLSEKHLLAGTQVKKIDNPHGLFAYVSKYMAKRSNDTLHIGRIWGIIQVEKIPWVKGLLCQLTENEAVRLIRYMRRYARLRSRDYKSLTILTDASFWYYRLADILYPP